MGGVLGGIGWSPDVVEILDNNGGFFAHTSIFFKETYTINTKPKIGDPPKKTSKMNPDEAFIMGWRFHLNLNVNTNEINTIFLGIRFEVFLQNCKCFETMLIKKAYLV